MEKIKKRLKCEDTIAAKYRYGGEIWGVFDPCPRNAIWELTSKKAFNNKPFKRKVCTYHKNQLVKRFEQLGHKYVARKLEKCEKDLNCMEVSNENKLD